MKIKYYKLKEIPYDFELRNDEIKDLCVTCTRYTCSINIKFRSNNCDIGSGFNETHNIGNILLEYAKLLNIDTDTSYDLLKEFKGKPIRVAFKYNGMSATVDNAYLGNFMEDKFIYLKELFGRC